MRIAIIGAGIVGMALARELRREKHEVLLVDAGAPGRGATWAAAGMLGPSSEAQTPGAFFDLCRAAGAYYPDFIRELEEETAFTTGYRTDGTVYVYHSPAKRDELGQRFAWQRDAGVPSVHLDESEVRVLEPDARGAGGFLLPGDAQVDNRLLAAALVESCRARGATFIQARVESVAVEGGRANGVVIGSEATPADAVVNAAGAWAGAVAAPGVHPEIRPVKGQMLALESERPFLKHVLHDHSIYLVPRAGGRVIAGATMEEAGFDVSVQEEVIERLRDAAVKLVPRLAHGRVAEAWAGLRPAAPDGLPRIGPTSLPGYFLATGHFRNGILLGPLTARLLTSLILNNRADPLITPFLP